MGNQPTCRTSAVPVPQMSGLRVEVTDELDLRICDEEAVTEFHYSMNIKNR
jgi:hypothetical protein